MPTFGFDIEIETLPYLPPAASEEQKLRMFNEMIRQINDINKALKDLTKTQILEDATGTNRMLLGYQEDGWGAGKSFGIKISQEGVDVTEATDSELLFRMDLETWIFYDDSGIPYGLLGKQTGGF